MNYDRWHFAAVRASWLQAIHRAIVLGEADAAYRLTVGFVRRCRDFAAFYKVVDTETEVTF